VVTWPRPAGEGEKEFLEPTAIEIVWPVWFLKPKYAV
jgi:hypothetical protein